MFPIQPAIFEEDNEYWVRLIVDNVNPNRYLISSHANIYDYINDKMIFPSISIQNGYRYVYLDSLNGPKMPHLLHRLVALSFIYNPTPERNQVNHIEGDKSKNHAVDLEWNTPKENTRHAFSTGLAINNIGENSHLAKLTNESVREICELLSKGYSYNQVLDCIGMEKNDNNRDMIGNIKRKIAWTHISKDYDFPEVDQRFRTHSKEEVIHICECLSKGMDIRSTYEEVFHKEYLGCKQCKGEYELIRLIKSRKQFTDISCNYDF